MPRHARLGRRQLLQADLEGLKGASLQACVEVRLRLRPCKPLHVRRASMRGRLHVFKKTTPEVKHPLPPTGPLPARLQTTSPSPPTHNHCTPLLQGMEAKAPVCK
eukprot:353556-Chlamydomonas_euryale.AAC.3